MTPIELTTMWMRRMGVEDDEIQSSLLLDPPISIEEEMKQIEALEKIEKRNIRSWMYQLLSEIKKENNLAEDNTQIICVGCHKPIKRYFKDNEELWSCDCHKEIKLLQ